MYASHCRDIPLGLDERVDNDCLTTFVVVDGLSFYL